MAPATRKQRLFLDLTSEDESDIRTMPARSTFTLADEGNANSTCRAILRSGIRAGQQCNRRTKNGGLTCGIAAHSRQFIDANLHETIDLNHETLAQIRRAPPRSGDMTIPREQTTQALAASFTSPRPRRESSMASRDSTLALAEQASVMMTDLTSTLAANKPFARQKDGTRAAKQLREKDGSSSHRLSASRPSKSMPTTASRLSSGQSSMQSLPSRSQGTQCGISCELRDADLATLRKLVEEMAAEIGVLSAGYARLSIAEQKRSEAEANRQSIEDNRLDARVKPRDLFSYGGYHLEGSRVGPRARASMSRRDVDFLFGDCGERDSLFVSDGELGEEEEEEEDDDDDDEEDQVL